MEAGGGVFFFAMVAKGRREKVFFLFYNLFL